MARNPYQHIDLRVNDHDKAWEFYSKILPAIGFPKGNKGKTWSGYDAEGTPPDQPGFGFTEDRGHRPNATRIASTIVLRPSRPMSRNCTKARRAAATALSIVGYMPSPSCAS